MNLPTDPYFMVSYRLIPKNQAKLAAPAINGAFSYLVEEKSVSVDIVERDLNLADLCGEDVDATGSPGTCTNLCRKLHRLLLMNP